MTLNEIITMLSMYGAVYWGGEYEDENGKVIEADITFCGDTYSMTCAAPKWAEFPLDNLMIIDGVSVVYEEVNYA